MSKKAHIITRVTGHLGFVELDRPLRANAYVDTMLQTMGEAFARHAASKAVRVIVVKSSTAGLFCSGADLDELGKRNAEDALSLKSLRVFDAIAACPKPTIAAIDGAALAGGLELALACDLRLASDRARFSMPETALGLIPAAGATFRLARIVGEPMAKQMILFGADIDAQCALSRGLVSEVVAPEDLDMRVSWWASRAARRHGLALRLAKQAIAMEVAQGGSREFTACAQGLLYGRRHQRSSGSSRDGEQEA